jgi:hypothetical protein
MKTLAFIATLLVVACGAPGRPSGLPAPEYEEPQVEPWQPAPGALSPKTLEAAPTSESGGGNGAPPAPAATGGSSGGSGATLSPGTP